MQSVPLEIASEKRWGVSSVQVRIALGTVELPFGVLACAPCRSGLDPLLPVSAVACGKECSSFTLKIEGWRPVLICLCASECHGGMNKRRWFDGCFRRVSQRPSDGGEVVG